MTVYKTTALAILIALAMIGGSFLVVGESHALTPQTGKVTVQITYGTSGIASPSTSFTIKDQAGTQIASYTTNQKTLTLNYGSYYIVVNPLYTSYNGNQIIGSKTVKSFTVGSPTSTQTVSVSKTTTYSGYLNVTGITSSSANVSLVTPSGFAFESFIMSGNSNVTAFLPATPYYVNVNYSTPFSQAEPGAASAGTTVKVDISSGSAISGFVTDSSGSSLNDVNVVLFGSSSPHSYTVFHFSGGYYSVQSPSFASEYVFISSPGYNTVQFLSPSPGTLKNVQLTKANSSVYYNYSLSSDLHTLSLKITYNLGNYTTIPNYFGNSSVGSLYWQIELDSKLQTSFNSYLDNLAQTYTDKSITVAGGIFNRTNLGTATSSVVAGSNSITGSINATYKNTGISSTLGSKGYTVNIYAQGTASMPGSLYYKYSFTYNNPSLALSSSSAPTSTFKSPVLIKPVSSSQWVSLTFSNVKQPAVQDSQIALYWSGLTSSNYLLNNTYTNTAFIAPSGKSVSFNASNAYFNPVTGKNDYLNAQFAWYMGGNKYIGYNTSMAFTAAKTPVTLNVTSPSGGYNNTTFYVITSGANPHVNYSVSHSGKTIATGSGTAKANVTVPQSSLVTYSAYPSSLNTSGYSVPLLYNWYMPNYTSTAENITYAFDKPYVSVGSQYAYLNVSTVFGSYSNLTFVVHVNDTTPPVPKMTLTNSTHKSVKMPTAGEPTFFSANSSTDPYYAGSSLTYKWSVNYANGTAAKNGSTTYNIVAGTFNSSYVALKFNTLNPLVVSLKATNPSGVSAYSNKTVTMIVNTPRMVVTGIYMAGNLTQGSKSTIYVNVSNNGTEAANSFSVVILINNKQVASQAYNKKLTVGQSANVSFNYTPGTSGKVSLVFQANNSSEPAFMAPLGSYTKALTINAPAYKTPLIIGSIIGVIVVVGLVYYRVTSSKPKRQRQPKPKTDLKKQQPERKK